MMSILTVYTLVVLIGLVLDAGLEDENTSPLKSVAKVLWLLLEVIPMLLIVGDSIF